MTQYILEAASEALTAAGALRRVLPRPLTPEEVQAKLAEYAAALIPNSAGYRHDLAKLAGLALLALSYEEPS